MSEISKLPESRAGEIAAYCIGQFSQSPESMMTPEELGNAEFHLLVRELVFYCTGCGWYFDADDRHDGDLCNECHDEECQL